MIRRLKNKRGFTLVELMIVVAIIGILAALAIYGVKKYLTNAKTGEAKTNIGRLGKDAVAAYERENMLGTLLSAGSAAQAIHRLCPSGAGVPATVPKGEKIQPNPASWDGAGWACLKFSVNTPVYYQYGYSATAVDDPANAAFTASATGNLDGDNDDGAPWNLKGGIVSNGVMRLAPTIEESASPEE